MSFEVLGPIEGEKMDILRINTGSPKAFYLEHIAQYRSPHAADGAGDAGAWDQAIRQ